MHSITPINCTYGFQLQNLYIDFANLVILFPHFEIYDIFLSLYFNVSILWQYGQITQKTLGTQVFALLTSPHINLVSQKKRRHFIN